METGVPGMLDRMRQAFCGLHGHDSLLQFAEDRMFLRCVSCGHESPGWKVADKARTPVAIREEARRQPLVRPHLVGVRRIA